MSEELGHSVGETLAVIEATKALEAKVEALTKERDELLWALRWETGKLPDSEYTREKLSQGAKKVIEIERKYATTAPNGAGA